MELKGENIKVYQNKWVGVHVINIGVLPISNRHLAVDGREFNLFFVGPCSGSQ